MERSRVAIVIPAFNEAKTISQVVTAARRFGKCVVVDDGSSDDTAVLAHEAGATVVSHITNRGYDAALDTGFRRAVLAPDCAAIITLDADGQHNPDLLQKFIDAIDQGASVVLGVRDRRQRLAEHIFAWYTQHRFGIADPLCGMKAYRVEVYRAQGYFDTYQSIGTELMLFGVSKGFPTTSVPFIVRERDGHPRFGRKLAANWKIFRALALSL